MNYSEPLVSQVVIFCSAIGCGILLGVFYDIVSFIRMLFGERKGVYIFFDNFYFIIASLVSFFFMVLYNSGQVRLNLMLAELFGGVAFHLSLGKYLLGICSTYLNRIRKIFSFLARPAVKTSKKLSAFFVKALRKSRKQPASEKNRKKFRNISNFLLKNKNKSV